MNKNKLKKKHAASDEKGIKQLTLSQCFSKLSNNSFKPHGSLSSLYCVKPGKSDISLSRTSKPKRNNNSSLNYEAALTSVLETALNKDLHNGDNKQLLNNDNSYISNGNSNINRTEDKSTKENSPELNVESNSIKRDNCSSSPELIPNTPELPKFKKKRSNDDTCVAGYHNFKKSPQKLNRICKHGNSIIRGNLISQDIDSVNKDVIQKSITENNHCTSLKSKKEKRSPLKENNSVNNNGNIDSEVDISSVSDDWLGSMFDNEDWNTSTTDSNLNLENFQYCEVAAYKQENDCVILTLKIPNYTQKTSCILYGYWTNLSFETGDKLSVKAKYDNRKMAWIVNDNYGFIVKFPDKLISGTSISSSVICLRRSVLSHMCPIYKPPESIMLIGSIIHELFQEVLKRNVRTLNEIKIVATEIEKRPEVLRLLYESNTEFEFLKKEMNAFVIQIYNFVNMYIKAENKSNQITNTPNGEKTWKGEILNIGGIEENFMLPSLGVKGKADVTIIGTSNGQKAKVMPLELKTGKFSYSSEHRGQLMLYILMMAELGMNVDSGLLLYLRENNMQEIQFNYQECTGLIMLRNELVNYLMKNEKCTDLSSECGAFVLPKPSTSYFNCSKCPYIAVCTASLSDKYFDSLTSGQDKLSNLIKSSISHLSASHIQYFFHWVKLLRMESKENSKTSSIELADIWHINPEERKLRGSTAIVRVAGDVEKEGNKVLHHMVNIDIDDKTDFTRQCISAGDLVLVSTDKRYAMAIGTVEHVQKYEISLLLERNLNEVDDKRFYIDPYYTDIGASINISNLRLLLDNTENAERLRRSIIDRELPTFNHPLEEDIGFGRDILENLNTAQQKAIFKVLSSDHYSLIKGMPGTGKTDTLSKLVEYLVLLNKTVLITSQTHSAVDNILLRLRGKVSFLRLGSVHKVHPEIAENCEETLLAKSDFGDVADIEQFYNKVGVVGITCMSCIRHPLLQKRCFDYCIVDEATQVLQPMTLAALVSAKKFVLVGDPNQLPPIVINKNASLLGLSESLFKRLDRPAVTSLLHLQYRMNEQITALANSFAYNGLLQCANDDVRLATIKLNKSTDNLEHDWLKLITSNHLNHSVVFISTIQFKDDKTMEKSNTKQAVYSNKKEGEIVFAIINALKKGGLDDSAIGIIASYRCQVTLLKEMARELNCTVEVNTIDQYQGRDKEVILYSCTRVSQTKESDILNDKRRLTVAITRAKKKLVIIGNKDTLVSYSTFSEILSYIPHENIISFPTI